MSTIWGKPDLFGTDPVLQVLLLNLRVKNEEGKVHAAKSLQNYVSTQSREMSTENFKRWMNNLLKTHIWNLINSNTISEKIGGIIAVDELIDVAFEEGAATSILAHYLHSALQTGEPQVMILAAKAIGHLSRDNSTITAGLIEFEMKSALEWLQGERNEIKRHAACLVLNQLAKNTPTLFYSYVPTFADLIWVALRDIKPTIRECATEALGACLALVSKREARVRHNWFQKIFDEALKGFSKQNTPDFIHGSLLSIGELLNHTGDFLKEKFNDVCQTILKYKDHKHNLVRRAVISLLPRLAGFAPDVFVNYYLNECIVFLLSALTKNIERPTAFIALGEIAMVVTENFKPYLENTVILIKLGLTFKGKAFVCQEALTCTSMLAKAVGPALQRYTLDLLDQMFAGGLNQTLTDALSDLAEYIPDLGQEIRGRLLDLLSMSLAQKPYNYPDTPSRSRRRAPIQPQQGPNVLPKEDQDKITALALNILGSFNFQGFMLSELLRDTVVNYLTDPNPEASICCCNIMSAMKKSTPNNNNHGYYGEVISEVLSKLLSVTVAETDEMIRRTVLTSLSTQFDHHLSQASNLASLFITLNDEIFEIREISLGIICRLSLCNPAYVLPALRTTLIHLLTQVELSGDNNTKEESSKLLANLIRDCPTLVKPYSSRIMKALLPKLRDVDPLVSSSVLATVGELAVVNGAEVMQHVEELMPLIIDTLQDLSSSSKREVALRTLGQLAESSGYVIAPYLKYPKLLDAIISQIQSERSPGIRKEVITVLGILGALDPYRHKMNQLILEGRAEDEEGTGRTQKTAESKDGTESIANLSPSSEDYYPTITIASLMRILKDPSLSIHHTTVIHVLMSIVKSLGMKSIQFLPQIMPPFLQVMKTCEPELRTIMFQQLGLLVVRVKQHIRDYLSDIFALIHQYWQTPNLTHIITLIEEISSALSDEFKPHLLNILPQLLQVFFTDANPNRVATSKVLHALEVFGTSLDDYLHLVIPVIVKLCEQPDTPVKLQIESMQTLSVLCRKFNVTYYASRILLPLSRIMDSPNQELHKEVIKTLCVIVRQLGNDYLIFAPTMDKIISKHHITSAEYEGLTSKLKDGQTLDLETVVESEPVKSSESGLDDTPLVDPSNPRKREKLNEQNLRRAWEVATKSTKEDWIDWLRKFSVELLKESPSPALRSCISLATDYHPIVKELFNAAFVSCWSELTEQYQDELVRNLETALSSSSIPPEILQTLLNLAEFMEQDEKPLPIEVRTLGEHAENCHAYAKALHYKELESKTAPTATIEALISINNQLQQPEAALGILIYAQKNFNMELKESWYEKLHRWKDALQAYERRGTEDSVALDVTLGKMRCLHALGEWEKLAKLVGEVWNVSQAPIKRQVAPLAAAAAWNLSNWQLLSTYSKGLEKNSIERGFFKSILAIHANEFDKAQNYINLTRAQVDTDLTALVGESYNRAYKVIVRVQQLAELEEIIKLKQQPERKPVILNIWKQRLEGCERSVDTWQNILAVRSLVLSPIEDMSSWLKFSSLCRKNGRLDLAHKTLIRLLGTDPALSQHSHLPIDHPRVTYGYIKQKFFENEEAAFHSLRVFAPAVKDDPNLQARVYHRLGQWQSSLQNFDESSIGQIISAFHAATKFDPNWYRAWHSYALANYEAASYYEKSGHQNKIMSYVVPAIKGFFRSVALSSNQTLQDALRILTLWFKHGAHKDVESVLQDGFQTVSIDTWLQVLPQIIARIHAPIVPVRKLINELLTTIGKAHPQALVYSLSVASKSNASARSSSAMSIMDKMRKHSATLVEQAQLVSHELIRVSILWHEMWHEGLEEASRTYFADHNTEAMLSTLKPLHEMLERGPETIREVSFQQAYGRDLQDAYELCKKWERSKKSTDLNQAWDLYYKVFRRINKQLPQMSVLELQHVSPKLLAARDLELAVPGTYRAGAPIVRIKSFNPTLNVINSKQRPRKLIINGNDGADYMFLLKGHEDLRQDERVMQLFGLVNTLLASEYETSKDHLNIQRYSVIPLSPNSGLIGWFPHGDTLHQLIRDYRDSRKILINIEHRLMLQMAPDYDNLPLMHKVEAFEYALDSTNGQDLEKILWLKSSNSEVWLDRRTNYTRSLAVMSMVGYILGLGDRHPSNLMLDRHTGKIVHIDFGDCFEVAMHREKYPEKIPFRLTRMLINAMEVSGIEGTFRFTCEKVMRVLRENKESLIAVLEAFVYDPIINWRLLTTSPDLTRSNIPNNNSSESSVPPHRSEPILPTVDAMPEILNRKALQVIKRVSNKLTGRDFGPETLGIPEQVQKLVLQATSHENLCQCYIGWCPFW